MQRILTEEEINDLDHYQRLNIEDIVKNQKAYMRTLSSLQKKIDAIEAQLAQTSQITTILNDKEATTKKAEKFTQDTSSKLIDQLKIRSDRFAVLSREIDELEAKNTALKAKVTPTKLTEKIIHTISGAVNSLADTKKPADTFNPPRILFANPLKPAEEQAQIKKQLVEIQRLIEKKTKELNTLKENKDFFGRTLLPQWDGFSQRQNEGLKQIENLRVKTEKAKSALEIDLKPLKDKIPKFDMPLLKLTLISCLKSFDNKIFSTNGLYDTYSQSLLKLEEGIKNTIFPKNNIPFIFSKLYDFYLLGQELKTQIESPSFQDLIEHTQSILQDLEEGNPFRLKVENWLETHTKNFYHVINSMNDTRKKLDDLIQPFLNEINRILNDSLQKFILDKNNLENCDNHSAIRLFEAKARGYVYQIEDLQDELKKFDVKLFQQERNMLNDYYKKAVDLLFWEKDFKKVEVLSLTPKEATPPPKVDPNLLRREAICKGHTILLIKYLRYRNSHYHFIDFLFKNKRRERNEYILSLKEALDSYHVKNDTTKLKTVLAVGQKYKPGFFSRVGKMRRNPEENLYDIVEGLGWVVKPTLFTPL